MPAVGRQQRRVRAEAVAAGIGVVVALVAIWWRTASLANAFCARGFEYLWVCEPANRLQVAMLGTLVVVVAGAGYALAWWLLRGDRAQQALVALLVTLLMTVAAVLVVLSS